MKIKNIDRWMLLLVLVLLTACKSSDEENRPEEDCYLNIYVYAPDRPIVTRGDVGEITPADAESKVHNLQIWVFKSGNGALVGYLPATPTFLNEATGQEMYRMKVDKKFADAPEAVDVYVVANAASCGLTTLNEGTSRADLDAANISTIDNTDYFGTSTPVSSVDTDKGLPMSAVLKNQPIQGSYPALRIGTQDQISVLQLTRAVSKLRFVLCQSNDNSGKELVRINSISLNGDQIPNSTWYIPREVNSYANNYSSSAIDYGSIEGTRIPKVADPLIYLYETQTAQKYEDKINEAVSAGYLLETGLTYLRESDRQLTGTIQYTETGSENPKTVEFSMAAPGDFLRNHSWIVYIFYMGSTIHVHVVTHIGMRAWDSAGDEKNVYVYNW